MENEKHEGAEPVEESNDSMNSEHEKSLKLKLTDWENEPTVSDLKQDYNDAAASYYAQRSKIDTFIDFLNTEGKARPAKIKGRSNIVPKLIRKQAEWRYAALSEPFLSSPDIFNVNPKTFEDKKAANQNALILNNQFNTQINKVKFIDEYVRAAVNEGTSIVRVGWEYESKLVTKTKIDYTYQITQDPAVLQKYQQIQAKLQEDPNYLSQLPEEMQKAFTLSMQQGQPIVPVPVGKHQVQEEVVVKNQPTVAVCDYRNIIIDPTTQGKFKDTAFLIYDFETSLSELKKQGIYHNLDFISVDENSPIGDVNFNPNMDSTFSFSDNSRKKIVAHEYWGYWDIHNTGIAEAIVATYVGNVMIRMEVNPFPDNGIPFVVVSYLPVKNSVYGEPDGVLIQDNQKIVGAVTRGMIDIMARSSSGQIGSPTNALDITNKRKREAGKDYDYNPNITNPDSAFHMHKFPELPQSIGVLLSNQTAEAEGMTGARPFGATNSKGIGDTATAARDVMDAASKREVGILRRLAKGMTDIGRKIIAMNAEFLNEEEIVRITNDEFIPVRRDDLAGNFDLELSISTAEADDKKAQELAFMLQTTAQSADPEEVRMIRSEIAKLRKMPTLARRISEYKPKPDPQQQQKMALEMELLQAQIRTEEAKSLEYQANAKLHLAKIGTEDKKAGNLASDTDLKNLDYVEQESGVKQDRDLEKIQHQGDKKVAVPDTSSAHDVTTSNGVTSV